MKFNINFKFVLGVITILVLIQVAILSIYTYKVSSSKERVMHTNKIIEAITTLRSDIHSGEIKRLEHLLYSQGEDSSVKYHSEIEKFENAILNKLKIVRSLTNDNLVEQQRIDMLEEKVHQNFIILKKSADHSQTKLANPYVDSIRTIINEIMQEEESELKDRNKQNETAEKLFMLFLGFFSFITYAMLFIVMYLLMSSIKAQKNEEWIRVGQAEINDILRKGNDITDTLKKVVSYLAKYLNAQVVTFYLNNEDKVFQLMASYGFTCRKGINNQISEGQGLVGQVALEKSPIVVTEIPENYLNIESGIGGAIPKNILVYPIKVGSELNGVMEFGTLSKFNNNALTLLERVSEYIALTIRDSNTLCKQKVLLEQTQNQSQELLEQQQELKAINEELEQQSEALKQSQVVLKQQSEELQASNEELEEKTQSLELQREKIEETNTQLQLKQKEIEEKARALELSSKYKSEFLANMSHELRTPLNSLLILSEILLENNSKNLSDDQLNSIQVINQGGKDLLNLINDILDISKVEAGKLLANIESVFIDNMMSSLKGQFDPIAKKKNVEFIIKKDNNIPEKIMTDRQRIEQILKNMLSNAFKFTESGSVTLCVHNAQELTKFNTIKKSPSDCVAISIIDTGIGIPKDKQSTVFEAFQQVDGSISRKYGGTGLGLTISNKLANMLGGELQLQSEVGKGSTFTLYIPKKQSNVNINIDGAVELMPDREEKVSLSDLNEVLPIENKQLKAKSLLIVEDDVEFSRVISKIAQEKGYESKAIHSGKAAIKYAIQHQPSAIILDLCLPDIDGILVLEQLKHNRYTRHIPVHVSSCRDEKTSTLKMGALGNILKPVTKNELDEVFANIEKIIQNPIKKVLVIEDNKLSQEAITQLIGSDLINIKTATSGADALKMVQSESFDCIILDLILPDMPGLNVLEKLGSEGINFTPVIVYTGKDLSPEEYREINQYASSIILKVINSSDRLLDEVTLFLHSVNTKMTEDQRNTIKKLHHHDEVLLGKRILLVDDDMRNLYALSSALRSYGLEVSMAANGKIALEKLDDAHEIYDLIIMDIMMPEMDGYEAMRHIRAIDGYKSIPILALTAKAMLGDEEKCISAGANDYLTKPVDINLLISMIRIWIIQNDKYTKTSKG